MLSPHERWELEKPAGQGPSVYEDLLSLRYPAYKDRIVKARAAGYTDDEILPRLQEREAKALLYYPADQVNERIGRTPETINSVELYERRHLRDAYVKAYEGKLTEQEVDERLVAAELINVQAPLLLRDGELYKKLAGHIKMREGWVESAWNGAVRDRLNKDESSLGMRLIYGEESEDLWKQLDELDGLQQQYMPAKDPSFSGSIKRGVGGAVEVLAQYLKGAYRGATSYGPSMAAAGASAAAIMNAPAFSNPITAPAAGASVISGGVTGFGLGVAMGAGMENFEREAGGAMVEYCRMKDEQGRPMDRNAARVAAVLTGAVNAGLEHFQLSTFLENIPGGDRLVQFFSKSGMKKLLAIPTVRGALAEIGKKYVGGIATESVQEMAQETMTILGGELGKIFSGQEFAGLDLEESIDRVLETGAQTVGTMAVSFLPGMAMNTVRGVQQTRAVQKGAELTAASLGISTDELMGIVNATDDPAQGRAVDGLGESPQASGPAMKDGVQLGPTREAAAKLEAQPQGQAVDGLDENGVEGDTNVYLPAQAIESYNQENPGLLEDLGIVVEPVEGTSEVKLTAEQYEALEDAVPELAEAVKNDVRRGSKGLTTREVGETLKKKAEKPAWRTAEVDGITKELEQEALSAGLDKAEARQWSKTAGAFIGVTSKRYNIAPSELARMELRRGTEETQGESFGQPVNAGVDLGQKVPILDLSGMEGTSTPKELLARLKDMALKDEAWISRDAEVFATLPRGKKLKHVAYSSRMPANREARALRSNIASGLDELVQNAVLIESTPNNDPAKTNVLNFHRLYVPVRTDAGIQTVRIVAEELKGSDSLKPTDVELYDVVLEGQKESPAVSHGLLAKEVVPSPGAPFELTIADILRGVKDAEGRPYVGEEYRQIGTKRKNEMDASLQKHRPDLTPEQRADAISEIEKLGEEVKAGGSPKHEKAATKWLLGGHIILPEDNYKILDALKICEQQHLDPMSFVDPNEILAKYTIKESAAEKRVNPDTVPEFSDKKEYPDGITVYTVQNDKAGQAAVRKIIDTHWGEDANPWCLAARRDESLSAAWRMWQHYDAIPKRIAFQGGKLLAFCAAHHKETQWWDREDKPSKGIPQNVRENGGLAVYSLDEATGERRKIRGTLKDGTRLEWHENGKPLTEALPDGTKREWAKNGRLLAETLPDGTTREWYKNGTLREESVPDQGTRKWYENGQPTEKLLPDGTRLELYDNGQPMRELPLGSRVRMFTREGIAAEFPIIPQQTLREAAHLDKNFWYLYIDGDPNGYTAKTSSGTWKDKQGAKPPKELGKILKVIAEHSYIAPFNSMGYGYNLPKESRHGDITLMLLAELEYARQHLTYLQGARNYAVPRTHLKTLDAAIEFVRAHKISDISPEVDIPAEVYNQSTYNGSPRQSEDYDPGDPKTWPEGPGRDEALNLLSEIEVLRMGAMHPNTWQDTRRAREAREIRRRKNRLMSVERDPRTWMEGPRKDDALTYRETLDEDGEVELDPNTWMEESPFKQEALEAWGQYTELGEVLTQKQGLGEPLPQKSIDAYNKVDELLWMLRAQEQERVGERLEDLREEEFNAVDEEMDRLDNRYSDLEDKESRAMLASAEPLQDRLETLISAEEESAAREAETYYQQRGPLTFKLTGEPVSGEYMAALEKLEAGEPVAAEEYNAIPEIQDARSRTATGSTLNATDREAIRKQVYDKLMSYGSAVTEVVDGQKRTVYNGEVRNDHRADIIIGLPASGKSSALVDPISSKYKSMIVDSDEAKKLIPEFDDGFGAGYVHEESKGIVSFVLSNATDKGENVVIPIVGSDYTKLKNEYVGYLRQKGYKVYVHMADINPNVAAGRNLRRFAETGRFVDLTATSFKYGNKPREVFERVKKEGIADGYSRIDTTVFPGRQVEGTEDISYDRGDLRERRGGVLADVEEPGEVKRSWAAPAGAGGLSGVLGSAKEGRGAQAGAAEGLGAGRAGGTSREGMAPRTVSERTPDSNARLTVQPDGVSLIEFFRSANRSTSFHELAHHMFRMIYELSGRDGVDPQLIEDVNTILREAGVTREEFDSDDAKVRKAARTKAHEFFARGFEVYISEGKAPSKRLRGVFRRLRAWMIEVYHDVVQALGIELSDEMRGVYDRLLAMPEEIDAETTIRELAVEEAALKEEIQRHEQEARERANAVKAAYREGVKVGREEAAAKARERMQVLKQKLQERQALKKEVNKLVKGINNMAKSESITWARHKELQKLLADYDLKKRRQETMDRRAELEEYLKENPEAADTMNAADLRYLGARTLNDMTLDDLRTLNEQVRQIYDQGKEEYKVWDLERAERRDTIHSELVAVLQKRKTNLPKIVTKAEDIKKQYKGVRGKLEKAKDWTYAATLGPDRLFDWFDKGATDYTGAFVRHLVDEVDKQRDVALRHIFERRKWMEDRLKPLGFRMSDFTRIAATVEGQDFTWDDIMEIYIGMRNDKKGRAILYGNLKNASDPEGTAASLIGLLTEDHKKAAELVVEDHNRNVDRIEAGMIHAFQKGMDRETDYTSIHRLEHLSSMGLIDAESAEALTDGMADAGVLRRVEDGFMKKRVEVKDENQTPIKLGLFNNWHEDVSRHEHAAAMASTARDLAGALLMRNPVDGQTIGKMVKERFGDEAWRTLVDFVNTNVTDDTRLAHTLLDGMCNTMMKNMAIAYLAGNLGTVLKQTTSIPRFLITAGPHRILVSIAQFLTQGPKFLEKVYELDPQMRDRAGSPILTMLRQDPRWGRRMYQRGLDWLLAPISMMDRWVAAIGWKATYNANLRRLGHEGAVREAQRAVRLTQQPANAKDAARMWRQNGFVRLSMIFTSDAAQTFGMTAYDLVQQLRSGKLVRAFSTLTALALTGILMKAASEGLPSDEDDEDEDRSWVLEAFMEQFISSIPLVGKEAMVLYDNLSGKRRGTQYSAFMTPIEKAARAWRLWTDEDSDEEDFRRATWLALEAFSLSGAAPLPVTGMRRIVQSMEMAEEDGMAAALNMVGIRRRPQ